MEKVWGEDPSDLHPSGSENIFMQHLASQYLAHEGYVETARALAEDGRINNLLLNGNDEIPAELRHKEDKEAVTRQRERIYSCSVTRPVAQ